MPLDKKILGASTLGVADKIRRTGWHPLLRIENTGGSVLTASEKYQEIGPDKLIYADGDSWFDKFSPLGRGGTNLLSHIRAPFKTAVVDCSHIGDTAESMVTGQQGRQTQAMFDMLDFDAILLSAGGNDLIAIFQLLFAAKAAQKVPPGAWFSLEDLERLNDPASYTNAFDDLSGRIRAFIAMRDRARSRRTRQAPILLHGYDYMQPRPAAAYLLGSRFIGTGPWLYPLMKKAGLSDAQMRSTADAVVDELHARLFFDIVDRRENIYLVDQRGLLAPGAAGDEGDSNDWLDEIHPNSKGFEKLARSRWETPLSELLGWNPDAGDTQPAAPVINQSTALASPALPVA